MTTTTYTKAKAPLPSHERPHLAGMDADIEIIRDRYENGTLANGYTFQSGSPTEAPGHPAARRFLGGIRFQAGPVRQYGRNGVTEAALLVVLIDRIKGHQAGQFPSEDNAEALEHLLAA